VSPQDDDVVLCSCGCGRPGRTPKSKLKPGQKSWATSKCASDYRNARHYVPVGKRRPRVVNGDGKKPKRKRPRRHTVQLDERMWQDLTELAERFECSRPEAMRRLLRGRLAMSYDHKLVGCTAVHDREDSRGFRRRSLGAVTWCDGEVAIVRVSSLYVYHRSNPQEGRSLPARALECFDLSELEVKVHD
jgi:hypothetical protein